MISPYADMTVRRWQRRRLTLALSMALGGMACSFLLGRGLIGREQNYAKSQFAVDADKWIAALQRIVLARLRTVSTTAAFFRGADVNDRKDFHTFLVQAMKGRCRPGGGLRMLGWPFIAWQEGMEVLAVVHVSTAEDAAVVLTVRSRARTIRCSASIDLSASPANCAFA